MLRAGRDRHRESWLHPIEQNLPCLLHLARFRFLLKLYIENIERSCEVLQGNSQMFLLSYGIFFSRYAVLFFVTVIIIHIHFVDFAPNRKHPISI